MTPEGPGVTGMDDPRVHEYRQARSDVMLGLEAPPAARDRYRAAVAPYLAFCAEFCPDDSPARRHYMAALAYGHEEDHGPALPLGAIAVAFRATEAELEWVGAQKAAFRQEPVDEQDRLAQMSYGQYLRTPHWHAVRKFALDYYEHKCAICNTHAGPLEVHHRTYTRKGAERPADVVVLCGDCHKRHHGKLRAA
jgi:hypothetical protein